MAFTYTNSKGTTYYLHGREVALNNDHQRDAREGALDQVPEGWQVMEGRNALPVLSKQIGNVRESAKNGGSKRGDKGSTTRGSGAGKVGQIALRLFDHQVYVNDRAVALGHGANGP